MTPDVFDHLKEHYVAIAAELSSRASQARLLNNPTAVGTEREEVYRGFLERHLPKTCDVFLGGFVFDLKGTISKQIDVIVTGGITPRFRMASGDRYIAPLEGAIGVAEIKSMLDRDTLHEALFGCASIPSMPDHSGILPPFLRVSDALWKDLPYKIIFAYDSIAAHTLCNHIIAFYDEHKEIPITRRPNIIHVLGKFMVIRTTTGMAVTNSDGTPDPVQPNVGQYHPFFKGSDASAMAWSLNAVQHNVFLCNCLLYKYDDWHTKIVERIQNNIQ